MHGQIALAIEDRSGVGEARRTADRFAKTLSFPESAAGALALVVTEAATNIVKHAGSGEVILRVLERGAAAGIEILALDRGPGLANAAQALKDGHSTAGSPGTGLGAIQRMSAEFDLHSAAGKGFALRAVIWSAAPAPPEALEIGAVCVPKPGEVASGDAWTVISSPRHHLVCVADGLGHGPDAAAAARAAINALVQDGAEYRGVEALLQSLDLALRPTRGAAVAVAALQPDKELCHFSGVGNISGCVLTRGQSRSMVSHAGILGHQVRKIQVFSYPLPEDALCIMHSDGLATRWRLDDYPGLERSHPALIAGVLYRDYSRRRDDAAVVVVRRGGRM